VALQTLQIIENEKFPEQAASKGHYLSGALRAALAEHPSVGEIRGKGLMCAVELVEDRTTKKPYPVDRMIGAKVSHEAVARGLFSRIKGDIYLLAPPIVITNEQLDRAVDILAESIKAVLP
jgi:L-2,4-diaminobutyrate transaminase